jgi:hypothetical protein
VSLDDLVPLFAPDPSAPPPLNFRQGRVVAWNPDTGENTIDVGGAQLEDVSVLNTGEAIALKVGHIVGLITWGSSWFIIGRITVPGSPDFASASVAFGSAGAQAFNFVVPGPETVIASTALTVPQWADEALIHVTGNASVVNRAAAVRQCAMQVGVDGGSGGGAFQGLAPFNDASWQYFQHLGASSRNLFTGLSGGETLTLEARLTSTGSGGTASLGVADGNNSLFMHAIAVFKSNV